MVGGGLMLFISRFNAFCPGFNAFCPILRPAVKPPGDCGTVGSSLILFISGLNLFVRGLILFVQSSDPLESYQVSVAQGFDTVSIIFAYRV
jgi:hypothetical protein